MKRKLIRMSVLILALVMCIAPTANAAIQASHYLTAYIAYIYPESNGEMSIWFEVQGTETMDEIGALSIRLQEKSSTASTWTDVKSFNHTDYPNLLGYDDNFYYSSVNYSGKVGYSYRAYVTIWAGQNGDGDSRVILTDTVVA